MITRRNFNRFNKKIKKQNANLVQKQLRLDANLFIEPLNDC